MVPYARLEVAMITLIGGVATVIVAYGFGFWALVPAVVALAVLSFYRDPVRHPPAESNVILAPADGRVVKISRNVEGPDGTPVLRVMIFLSIFDVHVNRSPCAGRVVEVDYRRGEFLNALRSAADTRNESNTVTIDPAKPFPGPIRIRQIAGVLARRIVCVVRVGERMAAGERFGMIKLGSRTEVCLPESPNWELCVAAGAKVAAGKTILAQLRPDTTP